MELLKQYSSHIYDPIEITDKQFIFGLNSVANFKKTVVAFDVEFQSMITNDDKYDTELNSKDDKVASFVREFGAIIFTKNKKHRWFYVGFILVNFEHLPLTDFTKYVYSLYATVSANSRSAMELNDKLINNNDHNIFSCYLPVNLKQVVYNQLNVYRDDELVKNRVVNDKQFLTLFKSLSKNSCFVVKGKRDIKAVCNSYIKAFDKKCDLNFDCLFDIEIYNSVSQHLFGDAKLKTTYSGITKTKIFQQHLQPVFTLIYKQIGVEVEHNPVVDSCWTVAVALTTMITLLNQYNKYKTEYKRLKINSLNDIK